jgi:hypothetical protein
MSGKRKGFGDTKQAPKKPKFYVDDGVTRYDIGRCSYQCLIANPDNLQETIGKLERTQNELHLRVTMDTSEHISSLTIRIVIEHEDNSGHPATSTAVVRLSAAAISSMALSVLTDDELATHHLRQFKKEDDIFYILRVTGIQSTLICAERLFSDSRDAQPFKEIADLFRDMTNMCLFIKGSETTQHDVSALEAQFAGERAEDKILAWHKNHENKVMAQHGMFLEKSERPTICHYEPKSSFFSWSEYMTVYSFGHVQEQEAIDEMLVELEQGSFDLRVVTLPKSANRRYLAFVFLEPGTSLRFSSDDRLKINFNPGANIREDDWSALVVDPVPWAPLNSSTILLTRPFDKDEDGRGTWRTETPFETADFNAMHDDAEARRKLAGTACVKVAVRVLTSNKVYRNCLTALQQIDLQGPSALKEWLLGNRMDEFPALDFYQTLRPTLGDSLETELLDLHGSQLEAALRLGSLRYGKQLVQGPPGTGKTHYAKQITVPFLLDDTQVHQGIMCSVTNAGVDEIALGMQALVEKVTQPGKVKPMIIRFHSLATENDVGFLDANKARPKPANARPSLVDDELDVEALEECVFLNNLHEHILSVTTVKEPLINDPRLKQLHLSLGIRMLQVAGMQGFECEYTEAEKFEQVREMYRHYKGNEEMDQNDMKGFKKAMKELRAYVLSPDKVKVKVTIIVCTVANLASPTLYRNASQVEWIIADEIPRVTEPMLWPALAHYPECRFHIFIGDPEQLPPQLQSRGQNNCFEKQLRVSMFTRFYSGGHVYEFFDKQYRAVSPIGNIVSRVFYANRLINGPGTDMDHPSRGIACRIAEYNKENYNKHSPVIFLDNTHSFVKRNAVGGSSYNISNCAVGINLAVDLVTKGFDPSEITILMPYNAQRRYYLSAVERADTMHPELGIRKIVVAVIDGYQGKENHVIILDWVVTEALGFFKERSRVFVAHSRAKDALYVIGDKTQLERNKESDMGPFKKLLGRDGLGYLRFPLRESQSSPYVSEHMIDVAMEVDMPQLAIDENQEGTTATEKTPDQVWGGAAAGAGWGENDDQGWGNDAQGWGNDAQGWGNDAQDWGNDTQDGENDGYNEEIMDTTL